MEGSLTKKRKKRILSLAQSGQVNALKRAIFEVFDYSSSLEGNHGEIEKLALKRVVDNGGDTMLHRACKGCNVETASYLLKHASQEDINAANKLYKTPLHEASASGCCRLVRELLRKGATWSTKHNGWTPLMYACEKGHFTCVSEFVDFFKNHDVPMHKILLERNKEGSTALYLACRSKSTEIVRVLLDYGADANSSNTNMRKPVHACAMQGCAEALDLLLAAGASVDLNLARDSSGSTIWHEAAMHGQLMFIKHIQQNDLIPRLPGSRQDVGRDRGGRHPLHYAALNGHYEIVDYLITVLQSEEKIDTIDVVDVDGATALHLACIHGHTKVVQSLVSAGANASLRTAVGSNTPLECALKWGNGECGKILSLIN